MKLFTMRGKKYSWANFKIFLLSISPKYWYMQYPYSKEWDDSLTALMDTHKFVYRSVHTCQLGPVVVWIANYPYAAFVAYKPEMDVRPSRMTIVRAHQKYIVDAIGVYQSS